MRAQASRSRSHGLYDAKFSPFGGSPAVAGLLAFWGLVVGGRRSKGVPAGSTKLAAVQSTRRAHPNESEIRPLAMQTARLATVFGCDPIWLAPRFDQIIRRYGHSADEAAEAAGVVAAGARQMATSFEEAVEALLIVVDGPMDDAASSHDDVTASDQFMEYLRAVAELEIAQAGAQGVRLRGGPMDGWMTLPDAPCLDVDWHMT